MHSFLDVLAESQKAAVGFFMCVHLSVCLNGTAWFQLDGFS
jgi:hypothetical protein